jgi:hypothetical protein
MLVAAVGVVAALTLLLPGFQVALVEVGQV